ncbi:hypothetical protein LTR34_007575 [Exophiala xenobiotica]|uniref:U1-type domain-containing protein n=1 Tax=Vermiconidia calcicola TaxID=1690605 RepID=A0AAV9Q8E9_9PEZI|nr:hypothetical protein LTR34_007575 [Exophiala xenobiotica]KAK5534750.1 hypothetical protein LTR23_008681 [Chaetothyriales sp. CCFEE 6169]KAK5535155.1 hypothetical protein LTR25_006163 [Vermiconidia calcicola]
MAVLSVPTRFPIQTNRFNSPTETTQLTGREFFRARGENILEELSEPPARVSYDLASLRQVGKLNYQVCQRCVVASSNYAVDEICEHAASRNHRGLFRLKTEAGESFDSLFYTDLFEHDSDEAAERIDPTTVATLGVEIPNRSNNGPTLNSTLPIGDLIHAPYSMTDVLMTGTMHWDSRNLVQVMSQSLLELAHPSTTNEDPAKEFLSKSKTIATLWQDRRQPWQWGWPAELMKYKKLLQITEQVLVKPALILEKAPARSSVTTVRESARTASSKGIPKYLSTTPTTSPHYLHVMFSEDEESSADSYLYCFNKRNQQHLSPKNYEEPIKSGHYRPMVDPDVKRKGHWVTILTVHIPHDASEQEVHDKRVLVMLGEAMYTSYFYTYSSKVEPQLKQPYPFNQVEWIDACSDSARTDFMHTAISTADAAVYRKVYHANYHQNMLATKTHEQKLERRRINLLQDGERRTRLKTTIEGRQAISHSALEEGVNTAISAEYARTYWKTYHRNYRLNQTPEQKLERNRIVALIMREKRGRLRTTIEGKAAIKSSSRGRFVHRS